MAKILIIGNLVKDVFLKLEGKFESDQDGIEWLDLAFNGSSNHYFKRTSIWGGAAITLEVLKNFGLVAKISGVGEAKDWKLETNQEIAYRYLLCHGEKINFLTPSRRPKTEWEIPRDKVDWLFVDRSAIITPQLANQIKNFLGLEKQLKLAFYLKKNSTKPEKELAEIADLVFVEKTINKNTVDFGDQSGRQIVVINPESLEFEGEKIALNFKKVRLTTDLTIKSTLAATVLAGIIKGYDAPEVLQIAKLNIEYSQIDKTLSEEKIKTLKEAEDFNPAIETIKLITRKGVLDFGKLSQWKDWYLRFGLDPKDQLITEGLKLLIDGIKNSGIVAVTLDKNLIQWVIDKETLTEKLKNQRLAVIARIDYPVDRSDRQKQFLAELEDYYRLGIRAIKTELLVELKKDWLTDFKNQQNLEKITQLLEYTKDIGLAAVIEIKLKFTSWQEKSEIKKAQDFISQLTEKLKKIEMEDSIGILFNLWSKQELKEIEEEKLVNLAWQELAEKVPEKSGLMLSGEGFGPRQMTRIIKNINSKKQIVGFTANETVIISGLEAWKGKFENQEAAIQIINGQLKALVQNQKQPR